MSASASLLFRIVSAQDVIPATPSDTVDVGRVDGRYPIGISIGVAGTLRVTTAAGATRNFSATELSIATTYPIRVTRVHLTGTDADEIKLWYG